MLRAATHLCESFFCCLQKIHRFWGKNVVSAARIKAKDDWRFLSL